MAWFASLTETPAIAGVAALEVLYGAASAVELRQVEEFLSRFVILWPEMSDLQVAQKFAKLRLSQGIGLLDSVTAAQAIRLQEEVGTFNVKHFRNIPGLNTVQPYS